MSVKSIGLAALLCGAVVVAAHASIQVGFSPEGSARVLVLDSINHAQRSIDMMAYSFQSADIVQAPVDAEKRGVVVRAVIDKNEIRARSARRPSLSLPRMGSMCNWMATTTSNMTK